MGRSDRVEIPPTTESLYEAYVQLAKTNPHAVALAAIVRGIALNTLALKVTKERYPEADIRGADALVELYIRDAQHAVTRSLERGRS